MAAAIKPTPYSRTWKPTPEQEQVVQAAVWDGDAAIAAWQSFIGTVDLRTLDHGTLRLLPLLYLNLYRLGVKHPEMERLQKIYRFHWYQNQVLLKHTAGVLQTLRLANVPTMGLKAVALIPLYYHDPGARPTSDIDILVPTGKARTALEVLAEQGWHSLHRPLSEFNEAYLNRMYAHTLQNAQRESVDLHRHVLSVEAGIDDDRDFWAAAIPLTIGTEQTLALSHADQLLHTIMHAVHWQEVSPVRWIADALVIMQNSQVDWDWFLKQTQKREFVTPVLETVNYLKNVMRAPIPAEVTQALRALPVTRMDRVRYELIVQPHDKHSVTNKLWYHYKQYQRLRDVYESEGLLRFPAFLRDTWNLNTTREVPGYMARYTVARLLHRPLATFNSTEPNA